MFDCLKIDEVNTKFTSEGFDIIPGKWLLMETALMKTSHKIQKFQNPKFVE